MKAVFLSCNQSMYEEVLSIMLQMGLKGFTGWEELIGRGSNDGEPHLGNHAWPAMNSALISIMSDDEAEKFLARMKQLDSENSEQGLRAFAWDICSVI